MLNLTSLKSRYPRSKGRGYLLFAQDSLHPRDIQSHAILKDLKSRGFFAQNKKLILVFFVLILLLLISIFRSSKTDPVTSYNLSRKELNELSQEEFTSLKENLRILLEEKDPRVVLSKIRVDIKDNNALLRSCHSLVHEVGRFAYEKYGDFGEALKYKDEICNSGYLHGVIESHFITSKNIFDTVKTVCNKYIPTSFIGWECFHGAGHGAMYYTDNDLPRSLVLCERYEDTLALFACVNGVFMENFNTDQKLHPSKYLHTSNPFYPCNEQKSEYKEDCYIYTPTFYLSLNKNAYINALRWCRESEKGFELSCIHGVGTQAMKENIDDPQLVETICETSEKEETRSCISGMVGLYINHFGGLEEASLLCEHLQLPNKSTCQDIVTSKTNWFTN